MTPTEAAVILRQATIDSGEMREALTAAIAGQGFTDLYDWVDANPELAVVLAENELATQEQLAGYAKDLEGGALGARQDNEQTT